MREMSSSKMTYSINIWYVFCISCIISYIQSSDRLGDLVILIMMM